MAGKLPILIVILVLSVFAAFPQGRGGGGQGGRQGGGQSQGGQGGGQQQGGMGGMQTGAGQGQMDRDRTRLNTQQRDQARACDQLADGIRKQARTMAKNSGGKNVTQAQLVKQRDQLREQVRAMEQEHERLMNGIDPAQQQQWREQILNMNQHRQQINNQLQQLGSDIDSADPNLERVAERAREMERIMKRWRDGYGELLSQ